jgi:RimJ/RimL family protein N-acetyltransferase
MDGSDLDFVAAMLSDAEVMRHYPKALTRDEARAWLERQLERYRVHGHGLWMVVEKATEEPVGQVGLVVQRVDGVDEVEAGYLIARPHWRRGFATEAAAACRDHALTTLGRSRVVSLIRPENLPSQGVARKLGMLPVKRTTHAGLDHIVFAVGAEVLE